MNCLHPDINNMRCWICPHNPFTRDMPPYVVCCAPLSPEMIKRLRADCREDDLTITTFDVIFDLPAELDHASRDRIKNMGFHFADVPENSPIPGNTRFSFAPENVFTRNTDEDDNEDDEDEYWDEDDWDDEDPDDCDEDDEENDENDEDDEEEWCEDECLHCPDYPCALITGEDDEDEDRDDGSLAHLNETLFNSLHGQIAELQADLDDLLQSIFDLYPLFPDRKDVLSDMEDAVVEVMDMVDDLAALAETYNCEREED